MVEVLASATSIFTTVADVITANAYLSAFIGLALVSGGFAVFGRGKRAVM